MTIALPDSLLEFAEDRAAPLGFENVAAYVADLVRREADEALFDGIPPGPEHLIPKDQADLEQMLLAGLEGPPIVRDDAFWAEPRRVLRLRRDEQQKARS